MAAKRNPKEGRRSTPDNFLLETARKHGARNPKIVSPRTVETGEWVRLKCQYGCGGFGLSLGCPPHTPTPAQTRAMLDEYRRAVLFEAPDVGATRIAVAVERDFFLAGYYKAFGFGAGPCDLCEECTPDESCRHPHEARPAMEACGIDVFATVRKHAFTIDVVRTHKDPQHYFGLVLVE